GAGAPGNLRRRAGSVVVHDGPEALAQEGPDHGRELRMAGHLPLIAPDDLILALDPLHETRPPEDAAVRHRSHEPRDLHRRHEHGALPDRHVDRLAGWERHRLALAAAHGLGSWQEPALLARQVDGGRLAEPERARVLHDRRAADLEAGFVEEDVAR